MIRIRKFLDLSKSDQKLMIAAFLLAGATVAGLRLLPFQTLQRLLAGTASGSVRSRQNDRPSLERIAWAVMVASRYVPGAACLARASAARALCLRHGYPAQLHIGVTKGERGTLDAHAWVESEGKIIIGGLLDLSRYTRLLSLEGETA
jgi:hypothetical protein